MAMTIGIVQLQIGKSFGLTKHTVVQEMLARSMMLLRVPLQTKKLSMKSQRKKSRLVKMDQRSQTYHY